MSFEQAHAFVAKWEGGFSNHPNDAGGPTNHGISRKFLEEEGLYEADTDGDGKFSIEEIKALTKEDAAHMFRQVFWRPQVKLLDDTHPLCAWVVYDTGVNMGLGYAYKLLQQAIGGLAVDGKWGPKTWAAIKTAPDKLTAKCMIELRKARYVYLADANRKNSVFLRGWMNRCNDLDKEISKYD